MVRIFQFEALGSSSVSLIIFLENVNNYNFVDKNFYLFLILWIKYFKFFFKFIKDELI